MTNLSIFDMMTTYYNFEHSTKTKVVGSAPWGQLELTQPLNFNSMLKRDELPKQSELRLKGNSRLTDLLSCFSIDTLNCFIVSSKMHSILKDFNLQEHQWASCTIRKKDKTWDYHLLRFAQSRDKKRRPLLYCPEIVDWKNSVFFEDSHARFGGIKGNEPILKIDSYDDYLRVQAEYYRQFDEHENVDLTIGVMKFAFNEEYMGKNNPDMCWLFPLHSNPLISERLKTALEENEITGMETMEINSYICRNDEEVLGGIFKELGVR